MEINIVNEQKYNNIILLISIHVCEYRREKMKLGKGVSRSTRYFEKRTLEEQLWRTDNHITTLSNTENCILDTWV